MPKQIGELGSPESLFYFLFYIALIGKLLIVFFPTNARSKKASVNRKV